MIDFSNITDILRGLHELQAESDLWLFSISFRTEEKGKYINVTIFKNRRYLKFFDFYHFFSAEKNEKVYKQLLKYIKKK